MGAYIRNYIIYGILHGSLVGINRLQRKFHGRKPGDPLPNWWAYTWRFVLTINFVVLCRILFRAPDLESSWMIFSGLFDFFFVLPRYSPLTMALLPWAMPFTSHQDLGNEILLPIAFSLCGQRRRQLLQHVLRLFVGRWVLAKHSHLSTISFKPLLVV